MLDSGKKLKGDKNNIFLFLLSISGNDCFNLLVETAIFRKPWGAEVTEETIKLC